MPRWALKILARLRRAGAALRPAAAPSLIGQITRLSLVLLALGVAASLAAAELARRAAAEDLADFAMIDFLTKEIAPAIALCGAADAACLNQVYQNESGGLWRLGQPQAGPVHASFSFVVSEFAQAGPPCPREAERRIRGFAVYTCLIGGEPGDEAAGYRVAERLGRRRPERAGLIALELAAWRMETARAGERLVGGRALRFAVGVMALALVLILGASLWAVRRGLRRPFGRLGAELDAYRAGEIARIEQRYPSEIQSLADSLNRAIEKKSAVLARQRRNVAKMAHDLRHQLVAIDLAAREVGGQAGGQEGAAALSAELETLGALVERYLTLTDWIGPAEGARAAPIADALEGARKAFARRLRATPVEIAVDCPPDLAARIHETDLRIILNNLVGNAHRHAAGRIRLSARPRPQGGVEIAVEDDGPGIAAADRDRVLAWGGRLDAGPAGSGFGLPIVAEQVQELYGGALRLESAPGLGGLRAVVELPGRRPS